MDKRIKIALGIIGTIGVAVAINSVVKGVSQKRERKLLPEPSLPKGSDADTAINYGQIIGATVYPLGSYANVRSSAEVNDPQGLFIDFNQHNQLWSIVSPNAVGIVKERVNGNDGKIWYKITPLSKPSGRYYYKGFSTDSKNINEAFVRADVVTLKK